MKVSRQQAEKNREAILQVASAQLREGGLGQLSVAEVAKAAGLTHGALYSHFTSKDALVAAALTRACEETAAAFAGLAPEQLVRRYLSAEHRDNAGHGCPSAALLSEVRCQSDAVKAAFNAGVDQFCRLIGDSLGAGTGKSGRDLALFTFAAMVGGLAIARAMRGQDLALSDAMLQAVTRQLRRIVLDLCHDDDAAAGIKAKREGTPKSRNRAPRRPKPRGAS
jgi:TetR/AcrR family transcriptional repressor of nem operon